MASEQDMSNWTDLLHSSTKLLEQAAPSPQFPPLQVFLFVFFFLSRTLLFSFLFVSRENAMAIFKSRGYILLVIVNPSVLFSFLTKIN
jgi:hypothetical protein